MATTDPSPRRVALVTGASGGIGRAVAVAIAAEGMDVCLVGRDPARLQGTARQVTSAAPGAGCVTVLQDLSSRAACAAVVDGCRSELGDVDVLVSVAGGADNVDVLELDRDLVDAALVVKLLSTLWLAQLVAPSMRLRGFGRIVTVAGSAGTDPRPDNMATSFANVTALGLTRALSHALAPYGVTVNAVCPGPTDTGRWRRMLALRAGRQGRPVDDLRAEVEAAIPAGRVAVPEDVAAAVRFLVSDAAGYVHGNALYLDGGTRRGLP